LQLKGLQLLTYFKGKLIMARLSGKLTAKTLGWDRNRIGTEVAKVPADGGRVMLGTFVGIASGLKHIINNDTGEVSNGLKGQFRGISSLGDDSGKEIGDTNPPRAVTAGVLYLPGGIQDMIEGSLAEAQSIDPKATVRFGIKLYAIPATNKAGYSFDADTLIEAQEADPLADLLALATTPATAPAALEAPAVDTGKKGK
jgi:hypothetical protein